MRLSKLAEWALAPVHAVKPGLAPIRLIPKFSCDKALAALSRKAGETVRMLRYMFALLGLLFFVGDVVAGEAVAKKPPNILMIAIDDLNDWVGCLDGHPQVQTPHIDRLAKRGTVFTNAHCQAPLCNASRTSLMTGLRPSSTGVYGLAPWFRTVPEFADVVTMPQHLAAHGYRTASTGKLYHGGYGRRPTDTEFQALGPGISVGAKPEGKLVNTPHPHPQVDWGWFPHRDEDKGDWHIADWAIARLQEEGKGAESKLESKSEQPFFLTVGFFLPHVPCYATEKWFQKYPLETLQLPNCPLDDRDDTPRFSWYMHWKLPEPRLRFLQEANQHKNLVRSYLACISFVDDQVGRVLDALEKNGLEEDTLVVLWSDHGWHLGEKLITGKTTLWERSTRVPLVFAGPGVSGGAECRSPVELLDIYPTLIEVADLAAKPELEGVSLAAQLQESQAQRIRPAITTHNQNNHAVRSTRWRYIRYADGSEELYDTQNDRDELNNLAGEEKYASVMAEHRRWLPEKNLPLAPGSRLRILDYQDGKAVWEGEPIDPSDPIPGIEVGS